MSFYKSTEHSDGVLTSGPYVNTKTFQLGMSYSAFVYLSREQALALAAELTAWAKPETEKAYILCHEISASGPDTLENCLKVAKEDAMHERTMITARAVYEVSPGELKVKKL